MYADLKLVAKTRFSAAILILSEQTESRFLEPICSRGECYLKWAYPVGILKIRTLDLKFFTKSRFSAAILNFPSKPEVDFENQNVLEVNAIFSEHIPLEFWKSVQQISSYSRKPGFRRPFWIFQSKPEVDF